MIQPQISGRGIVAQDEQPVGHFRHRLEKGRNEILGAVEVDAAETWYATTAVSVHVEEAGLRAIRGLNGLPHRVRPNTCADSPGRLVVLIIDWQIASDQQQQAVTTGGNTCGQEAYTLMRELVGPQKVLAYTIQQTARNPNEDFHRSTARWLARISVQGSDAGTFWYDMVCHARPMIWWTVQFCPRSGKGWEWKSLVV